MLPMTCTRTRRVMVLLMCGSVLTFLIQQVMFQGPKVHSNVLTMISSEKETQKKFVPVAVAPPSLPIPGTNEAILETTSQTVDQSVGEDLHLKRPNLHSLAENMLQYRDSKSNMATLGEFPQAQVDLSKVPASLLYQWMKRLSENRDPLIQGHFPNRAAIPQRQFLNQNVFTGNIQRPFLSENVLPQLQAPLPVENFLQNFAPNGNLQPIQAHFPNMPHMQRQVPIEYLVPQMQGLNGNVPQMQGHPMGNIAPRVPMQGTLQMGNAIPQVLMQDPNGNTYRNTVPTVELPVPGSNINPQNPRGDLTPELKDPNVPNDPQIQELQHLPTGMLQLPRQGNVLTLPEKNEFIPPVFASMPLVEEPEIPDPLNEITGGPETKILRWSGKSWTQLQHFCAGNLTLKRTMLKSPVGNAIIYIHDLKDDKYVSGSLKTHGLWDLADVNVMIDNLKYDAEIGFIDIGSHVGTFSLVAGLMGKKVVAVDPLVSNVIRLCRSVQANNFTDQFTIFYTAISDGYKKVSFSTDIGNIGGTRIQEAPAEVNTSNVYDPNFIDTVRLDDLIPYIPFKRAFIKMDVEEHEYEVVSSGGQFFNEIDVRGILMEWMWQRTGKNGLKLRDLLYKLNFRPYFPDGLMELDMALYQTWPDDVLWKKV